MIFTLGLIGTLMVVAFCRLPGIGYWKGFTIKHRASRLTPHGRKLFVASILITAVGFVLPSNHDDKENGHQTAGSEAKVTRSVVATATPQNNSASHPAATPHNDSQPLQTNEPSAGGTSKPIQSGAYYQCVTTTLNFNNNPDFQPVTQLWDLAVAPSPGLMKVSLVQTSPPSDPSVEMYQTSIASDDLVKGTNPNGVVATLNPRSRAFELEADGNAFIRGSCERRV